jgi:hypothetical protein
MKMAIDTLLPNKGERRITRRPPSAALVAKIASLGLEESLSFAWTLWFALAMSNPPNARRKTGVKKFICFILHCSEAAASAKSWPPANYFSAGLLSAKPLLGLPLTVPILGAEEFLVLTGPLWAKGRVCL